MTNINKIRGKTAIQSIWPSLLSLLPIFDPKSFLKVAGMWHEFPSFSRLSLFRSLSLSFLCLVYVCPSLSLSLCLFLAVSLNVFLSLVLGLNISRFSLTLSLSLSRSQCISNFFLLCLSICLSVCLSVSVPAWVSFALFLSPAIPLSYFQITSVFQSSICQFSFI